MAQGAVVSGENLIPQGARRDATEQQQQLTPPIGLAVLTIVGHASKAKFVWPISPNKM
jgi:hypothetical protein